MEINKEILQMILVIIQIVGIPLFVWVIRKLTQIHRSVKLNNYKHTALVQSLSKQYGNGEFKKDYDKNLEQLKSDYNFIYKE